MPQDKKKPKEYYGDMTESLNRLKTPLTKKEELQAVAQRAKLIEERKRLNPQAPKKFVGKDMSPYLMMRQMEKKASQKKMDEPTSTKRVVGNFYMKTMKTVPKKK